MATLVKPLVSAEWWNKQLDLVERIVVEVPCYVDGNGISVPKVGPLPDGCAAICSQSAWVQRLAVKAAVTGDASLLQQAALLDPLTGAVCTPPEVWQMVDEMLVAQARWLPQYAGEIEKAEARIARAKADGSWIPPRDYRGAARLRQKTVEEMALDAERMRRMASAAAKESVE